MKIELGPKDGVTVVVKNGRYDIFGAPTVRNQVKAIFLQKMGVNEEVPEGVYKFNIKRQGLKPVLSLTPLY